MKTAAPKAAADTPMMRQYRSIKAHHPDAFLFYRMGDFYELFLSDAERAAPLLDITLTTRGRNGKMGSIPMCGVPVHSADGYIKRLTQLGHRVAICEQVEDPKASGSRKLVRRDVIEVFTPGLVGDPQSLEAAQEVALAAVWLDAGQAGLAALDASTGNFRATELPAPGAWPVALLDELERIAPRELLIGKSLSKDPVAMATLGARAAGAALTVVADESFTPQSAPTTPDGFDPESERAGLRAAAAILGYLATRQPTALQHAPRLRHYGLGDTMILDAATRRHLELFENSEDRSRRGALFERMDETRTALGARRLARWVAYPLCVTEEIVARQDAVAWLAQRDRPRARLREALAGVRDLERIFARCARPGAEPRDLAALRASLSALPEVASALDRDANGDQLYGDADEPAALPRPTPLPETTALLWKALVDDPKPLPRGSRGAHESGFVREGFSRELDGLSQSAREGRTWIAGLETVERDETGIPSLKVRFHPVHGYTLEVPKAQLARVPDHYERRQTLASAERFTTKALREMESKVVGASERVVALEREILDEVRRTVLARADAIRAAAEDVATLDALQSLAEVARRDNWQRPTVDAGLRIEIRAGRHPVVESMRGLAGEAFVANDTELDPGGARVLLITGPNMAGKSTYLRQVAVLVLLAQIGSFVPAESATIGVVDRIFTRVGASDRLSQGESTFMVEMRETAEILSQASPRSLVILDEIGRGTSTFDGLSIAWAVGEYLHDTPGLGPRTLFATHYHELADLARTRSGVRNAHFEARESGDEVVFLRQLLPGEASRSYGIQVARLAGLPQPVIARAREVLTQLEAGELSPAGVPRLADSATRTAQPTLPLFTARSASGAPVTTPAEIARAQEMLTELRRLDIDRLPPIDALSLLNDWAARLRQEDEKSKSAKVKNGKVKKGGAG